MNRTIYLPLLLLLCFACANEGSTNKSAESNTPPPSTEAVKPEAKTDVPTEPEQKVEVVIDNENLTEELKAFIPDGYDYLGHKYGDLNKDDRPTDAILALKSKEEEEESMDELPRPLLVLVRDMQNKLQLKARNDAVVLCSICGGVMGDPFQAIAIKNGYFSVEQSGGSRYRWLDVTTFKYDEEKQDWYLHKKGNESYDSLQEGKKETTTLTKDDFGIIAFKDFETME